MQKDDRLIEIFGERVLEERLKQDLTQLDLATLAETDERQIRRIEKAENAVSFILAYKVSQALKVNFEDLMVSKS